MLVIPGLGKQRQSDHEFKVSLATHQDPVSLMPYSLRSTGWKRKFGCNIGLF